MSEQVRASTNKAGECTCVRVRVCGPYSDTGRYVYPARDECLWGVPGGGFVLCWRVRPFSQTLRARPFAGTLRARRSSQQNPPHTHTLSLSSSLTSSPHNNTHHPLYHDKKKGERHKGECPKKDQTAHQQPTPTFSEQLVCLQHLVSHSLHLGPHLGPHLGRP